MSVSPSPSEQLDDIFTGDLAEAWNVQRLIDLIKGVFGYPVSLTKHSSPDTPTLKLRNGTLHGPILDIVGIDGTTLIMQVTDNGMSKVLVGDWVDWDYQPLGSVPSPGAGSGKMRMYARAGHLYFQPEGAPEQPIPIGLEAGPSLRYGFWQRQ